MSLTYSRCVSVALVIQHAMRMRRIILSSLDCPALGFSTLSHNGTIFKKKKLLKLKCVFWFSLQFLSQIFLILGRIQEDIIINVQRSSCKVPVILVMFNETWIFSTDPPIILKYQISLKSFQFFHVGGRIDRHIAANSFFLSRYRPRWP